MSTSNPLIAPISAAAVCMCTTDAASGISGWAGTSNSVKQWQPTNMIRSLSRMNDRRTSYSPA